MKNQLLTIFFMEGTFLHKTTNSLFLSIVHKLQMNSDDTKLKDEF